MVPALSFLPGIFIKFSYVELIATFRFDQVSRIRRMSVLPELYIGREIPPIGILETVCVPGTSYEAYSWFMSGSLVPIWWQDVICNYCFVTR